MILRDKDLINFLKREEKKKEKNHIMTINGGDIGWSLLAPGMCSFQRVQRARSL